MPGEYAQTQSKAGRGDRITAIRPTSQLQPVCVHSRCYRAQLCPLHAHAHLLLSRHIYPGHVQIRSHAMNGSTGGDALGSVWDADVLIHACHSLPSSFSYLRPFTVSPRVVYVIHPSPYRPVLESMEITVFVRIKTVEHAFSTRRAAQELLSKRLGGVVRLHVQEALHPHAMWQKKNLLL